MPRWDDRLLKYVNEELQYLWHMGAEFEDQNPGVAPNLKLTSVDGQDPFVERLLDGFAFMSARVRLKLEDEFPRFTQALLESVHPNYLSPTPAATVVEVHYKPDEGDVAEGHKLPRDTVLTSARSDSEVKCTFLTKHDVTLWPIAVREAAYVTSNELGNLRTPLPDSARAAVRIKLETRLPGLAFSKMEKLDRLTFYLKAMPHTPVSIYEQLFAHSLDVLVRPSDSEVMPASRVGRVGFDPEQAMFPVDRRCFDGYRLLREYFTLPERFLFFEISKLNEAVTRCGRTTLELIIPFKQEERALWNVLGAQNFALHCTPAINLFPLDIPTPIRTGAFEFPLISRLYPECYEVFNVKEVTATGSAPKRATLRPVMVTTVSRAREETFLPFYHLDDRTREANAYFTLRRLDRRLERAVPDDKSRDEFIASHTGPRRERERDRLSDEYEGERRVRHARGCGGSALSAGADVAGGAVLVHQPRAEHDDPAAGGDDGF
jgi:type VI secretion system protein ImpG